jgi:hypothetical protein
MEVEVGATAARRAQEAFVLWLDQLRLGQEFLNYKGLALLPIYRNGYSSGPAYSTLEEALKKGTTAVREEDSPVPSSVQVHNSADVPVLIHDGEEIAGGRQHRVANTSVLVPACGSLRVPVTCIEQLRWQNAALAFGIGEVVYPTLRRQKVEQVTQNQRKSGGRQTDQDAIWKVIDRRLTGAGIPSSTRALSAEYAGRQVDLAEVEETLQYPPDRPVGVVACWNGRARCADIFDRNMTLSILWRRLVRSYMLDALGVQPTKVSRGSVRRLLLYPVATKRSVHVAPGLGLDIRISDHDVVGAALMHEGAPVHIAIFRCD